DIGIEVHYTCPIAASPGLLHNDHLLTHDTNELFGFSVGPLYDAFYKFITNYIGIRGQCLQRGLITSDKPLVISSMKQLKRKLQKDELVQSGCGYNRSESNLWLHCVRKNLLPAGCVFLSLSVQRVVGGIMMDFTIGCRHCEPHSKNSSQGSGLST